MPGAAKASLPDAGVSRVRPPAHSRPTNVDDLTNQNVRTIVELERAEKAASSPAQQLSSAIAAFCGSMAFIWIHVAWFGMWILVNTLPQMPQHPDPFPFPLLTLIVSLEAIFLSAFILISQNQENRLTEHRSHLDLQINLLTEQENTKMLKMLRSIADKVGADTGQDADLAALEASTQPEKLIEQLEAATTRAPPLERGENPRG